ncbi:flagellin FliC [Mizugakiibacter sediminis]|uniref:Flagellin n=1 Tax=Mizugakiibacter sediminis TaxID=1475481 RepID=A0A0K8QKQ9_9GAMM|nr:flagellin [Mizugakiibacter sediminis]GAP65251.1 flagellin FliC [Mizugakiibacter sediminis]
MSAIINTNIMSLNAQRNLSSSQDALSTSLERLSSGLRINSAKDDAAGLAIATRFTTQINGLNQAVRNANDGVSLAQTAESALSELTNNLQRIRELAVQSANATNSATDRAALDQEVQQRIAEVDRITKQTTFNGLHVLDGTFGTAQFQVGANVGDTISVNLSTGVGASQIGQIAKATSGAVTSNALTAGGVTIAVGSGQAVAIGASVAGSGAGQTASSAYAKAAAINASGVAGLTATASNSVTGAFTATGGGAGNTYSLSINGVSIYSAADTSGAALTGGQVAAQINLYSSQTGVSASFDSTSGNMTLSTADGRDIAVTQTLGGGATGGLAAGMVTTNRGTVTLSAADNITMTGAYADLGFSSATIAKDSNTLSNVNVTTVANANDAINRVDSALQTVSSLRSTLGAIQNRFQSTISNLQAVSQNLSASRSRIQDADFAAETANMSRAQILQQAGVSVLAQANSMPQTVLKLLG